MRIITGLLSAAIIGGGLMAGVPAQADTAYHRVYRQPVTIADPFSILDQYQNNALRPEEYKKGNNAMDFDSVDMDDDGFLSRTEFYRSSGDVARSTSELTAITPAAGGDDTSYRGARADIVYRDDPCDVIARRNDPDCR